MQKSSRHGLGRVAGFMLIALVTAVPAFAHHGWGGYSDKEFEITGVVQSSVSLAGPHATMKIKSADGRVWDLTLAPPFRTEEAGLKQGMIPVGAMVTAHGHRHKEADHYEVKTERLTWGNRVFNVYPDRE